MARPNIEEKKRTLSVSINIKLDEILDNICQEKNINKSKYIEYLIKKDMEIKFTDDIDTVGNCANCGVEFHIHKEKKN